MNLVDSGWIFNYCLVSLYHGFLITLWSNTAFYFVIILL